MDVVEGKRKAAKNENEFIYHEEVPDKDALPEIKGAALVKGIPFVVTDPDIAGPDIFGRLVPMKAHEASSLYSEEKAKLLRKMGALMDEKDQELVAFMSSLHLDCVNAHLEPDRLPQDIVDRCAALSAKPDAIQNLIESMDKLSDIYHDVEAMLKEIMELIHNEEVEEKEYQEVMGSRPPSIVATDLTREANKYEEAHNKAAESNKTLHKAMTQHIANLRLLELPLAQLAQQIPTVTALNLDQQPIVNEMQHLVGKVEEMRRQRAMLATQLRESVCGDDITAQLVTRQHDNLDTIFQEELQKHSKYVTFIEQNLAAQENIIKALTDAYAQYAPVRKATMEVIRQRNMTLSALMSSYDAYEDLIAKSNKGQEFYRKLETNVTKLLQRVKGTCKVQQEERDTILAKNCKTLPSKVKPITDEPISQSITSSGTGGPKLKDYLDNYKRDKAGGYSTQSPAAHVQDAYYSAGSLPSSNPVGYHESIPQYDTTQSWIPSVRPAPVGQEGTCPSTTSQDLKPEPTYSGYTSYPGSKPYGADNAQLSQHYADQYSSYMSQYQQYPTTSSPYHMPSNYPKSNEPMGYSKVSPNYPPSTPSPQLQGGAPSTAATYPVPAPSPSSVGHNYLQPSYDPYKVPTTVGQGYTPPTTLPQAYGTYSGSQYSQNYTNTLPQNVNYPSQVGQIQPENYPSNLQHMNAQYPNSGSQTYQTQNIPQIQNYSSNSTIPQHSYPSSNPVPQGTNYQIQATNVHPSSSQPSIQAYQNPTSTYPQTSVSHRSSLTSIDQTISNNFSALQGNLTAATTTTYSTQGPLSNAPSVPVQEKQEVQGYPQQQNISENYNYPTPSISQGVSQNTTVTPQYSSYIPQNYTSYLNNEQYSLPANYSGAQPWQSSYDVKNTHSTYQNYYATSQYQNYYSEASTELQYTPATAASHYTRAGVPIGPQTSSSIPTQSNQMAQPNYTQGNYYHHPYGYQYTSGTLQSNTVCESPSSPRVYPGQTQGQVTPQSPMTYMQASNSNLKLTFSQDSSKDAAEEKSNIDLLAGLDFSLSQDPLVPQQKVVESPAKVLPKPAAPTVSSTGIEEKIAAVTLAETTAVVPDCRTIPLTPKKSVEERSKGKFQLKDPFNDTEVLNQFVQEVEKFEKFVESLTMKTLNGPTLLDIKWKELLELQERDSVKHSISVARCYPVKNRFPDILPYDNSRVELPSTKDDYINASYVKDITPNFPDFIVTQLPLSATFGDFWTMILEQQVELIVC
ncbi:tyrosine-protein phosphatase non-receptor type 23-like, partial [Homalodisca vitripennis]|uniref:tyrosine-protein phosphatase non-receptor type 23-like n=1 Tax=Homalodisca vitripennis TaxID=197043 RepID=UPI001EEAF908